MHLTQAKIKLYEDSFNHMKNCTGKDEIKDVVLVFKQSEETNQNLQQSLNDLIDDSVDAELEIKKI